MEHLETEIKFYCDDLQSMRQRILAAGAQSRGRFFESNVRFEDDGRTLIKRKSLLRLRRDQTVKLTFKSTPAGENSQFKVLRELEVEVGDYDGMRLILEALGYHPEQVYEKWRETLVLDQALLCLDSMPYGNFIEIEGPGQDIKNICARLGLPWDQRILLNYLQIFEIIKDNLHFKFSDVTFDNFSRVKVNPADYLDLLVVGN